ncbi:MAG TPA: TonB family protein [Acidobacteriota bacterium]|nr:TonB family protein [Acidobacteriota bacterium]HQM62120.1 TonB family protein [Acidobacteriota bacterium]
MTENSQSIKREALSDLLFREERRPLRPAIIAAIIFHIIIFFIRFPDLASRILEPTVYRLVNIQSLAPPQNAGGGRGITKPSPETPQQATTIPKPDPVFVPVPDLTPDQPEPTYEPEKITLPTFEGEIVNDLSLGEIYAPGGGTTGGGTGGGYGGGTGTGIGPGEGDGVYSVGAGIIPPEAVIKPSPKFTDDAIRNRISGVVLLYGIIRKDGRVDSLKVIRSLGYGLDEEALTTVATKWKFRPAMKDGRPVDCYVTIEVSFTLY